MGSIRGTFSPLVIVVICMVAALMVARGCAEFFKAVIEVDTNGRPLTGADAGKPLPSAFKSSR